MAYTNVLNMLDLSGIPLRSGERRGLAPLIIAGGTSCINPEPLADFIDLFIIGEGEEATPELLELYRCAKLEGMGREDFLKKAAQIGGVYVPSLYYVNYNGDGTVNKVVPSGGAPETVPKRIVKDFDGSYYPTRPIVPSTEIIHDRVTLELFRGCIRGCRFCQAGYAYRPVRSRGADTIVRQGIDALENTGYDEVSLSSLSTSDYRPLKELCDGLLDWCEPRSVGLSLPSLRADNFSMDIMERVQKVRKSGLTFAPEAGSQRLRGAINKNVKAEDLIRSCGIAFAGGWSGVKLYFMLGLPTETDEDVIGIADLAFRVLKAWKENSPNKSRGVRITVSTSCFVPKPHTPFQWEAQISMEEYKRRVKLLCDNIRSKSITYNWHDPEVGFVEAALSRGDRRLGKVIETVWKNGGKMESWSENFSLGRWTDAFRECALDPEFYVTRERGDGEVFPWDHISVGVGKDHLRRERELCYKSLVSPDCRAGCSSCGADALLEGGRCDG
jgi:radical SAM family uncharacterized protein